jgi:hypothetical protein
MVGGDVLLLSPATYDASSDDDELFGLVPPMTLACSVDDPDECVLDAYEQDYALSYENENHDEKLVLRSLTLKRGGSSSIFVGGVVEMINCKVSDTTAMGGGIFQLPGSVLHLYGTTLSGNRYSACHFPGDMCNIDVSMNGGELHTYSTCPQDGFASEATRGAAYVPRATPPPSRPPPLFPAPPPPNPT